jgi:hypothetical protein
VNPPVGENPGAVTGPSKVVDVNRRILTLMVALVPIVVFGVLLAAVTVPYVSLGPGPAFDTLGDVDGKPVVEIWYIRPGRHAKKWTRPTTRTSRNPSTTPSSRRWVI